MASMAVSQMYIVGTVHVLTTRLNMCAFTSINGCRQYRSIDSNTNMYVRSLLFQCRTCSGWYTYSIPVHCRRTCVPYNNVRQQAYAVGRAVLRWVQNFKHSQH